MGEIERFGFSDTWLLGAGVVRERLGFLFGF
jgi:hypothetical protein